MDGGPTSSSSGTIWRIHKDDSGFQKLDPFCTSCAYGSYPNQIIAASDGNLYGTTGYGGIFTGSASTNLGCGLVFKLITSGVYTVLHALRGGTETAQPVGITEAFHLGWEFLRRHGLSGRRRSATKKGTISGGGAAWGVIYTITGLPPKS